MIKIPKPSIHDDLEKKNEAQYPLIEDNNKVDLAHLGYYPGGLFPIEEPGV